MKINLLPQPKNKFKLSPRVKLIGLSLITLSLIPVFGIWAKHQATQAKDAGKYLSPLADKRPVAQIDPVKTIKNINYYITLANQFLEKATRLANDNLQQNQVDRLKIISHLNQALKAANQAVEHYPKAPEGYLVRSKIFNRTKSIWPETAKLAKRDLTIAQNLATPGVAKEAKDSDLNSLLPDEGVSPLNYIPTKQAQLANNLRVAFPDEENTTTDFQSAENNATEGEAVIPAGDTEIKVMVAGLNPEDLVYAVPQKNPDNLILSVKARKNSKTTKENSGELSEGDLQELNDQGVVPANTETWFKVGLNQPSDKDIKFDWWIISNK